MKFGPLMFQCACFVSSARSIASARRALRMAIETAHAEVLADWLGLDAAAVAGLRQDGIV
jgi:hypothetical protein